jgi:hypothetical protein
MRNLSPARPSFRTIQARTRKAVLTGFAAFCLFAAAMAQTSSPVPQISNPLVPAAVLPGSAAFTLTVNGTGFVSGAKVYWNGSPRTTAFLSAAQLTAAISASDVATATSGSVTVHNPGGTISNTALILVTTPVSTPSFGASEIAQTLTAGNGRYETLAGDYDGDGLPDVVVNQGLNLEVMRGNGDGSLQFPVIYPIPNTREAYGEVMADFNNDGTLDFLVSDITNNSIDVFLSNHDATLQPPLKDPGSSFVSGATADFDGDGRLDLAYPAANGVGVLLGKGDGTFGAPAKFTLANSPRAVAIGDLNRDGIMDIIASSTNPGGGGALVSVLFGLGNGSFAPRVDYPVGYIPDAMAIGDLNGDGYPDVVVIEISTNTFYVLMNKGDGTLAPPVTYTGPPVPAQIEAIAMGDLNGDGTLDVAVYNASYCTNACVEIFAGNGDGTFQPGTIVGVRQDRAGSYGGQLSLADFNHNGKLDIATPSSIDPAILIQTNGPAPTIDQGSLSFAPQAVGTQSPGQALTFYQPGSTTISIDSVSATGDFQVPPGFNCVLIPGNVRCTALGVTFNPTAIGTRTGRLTVNSSGGTQYVSLVGTGVAGTASVSVSPSSLSFPAQTLKLPSPYQTVTIINTGTGTLNFTSIALAGNLADFVLANSCGTTLVPGDGCTVQIALKPAQRGVRTATLNIADNASNSPQTVALSGTGTTNSLSSSSLTFGGVTVGTASSRAFTLTNVGVNGTSIGKVWMAGTNRKDFTQSNDCGTTLAAKASCTFTVTFTPGSKGSRNASLVFNSNGTGTTATTSIALTGTGN